MLRRRGLAGLLSLRHSSQRKRLECLARVGKERQHSDLLEKDLLEKDFEKKNIFWSALRRSKKMARMRTPFLWPTLTM